MRIHVCSLARLHATVAAVSARRVVTLINAGTPVPRPASIAEHHHLFLGMNDIDTPQAGFIAPEEGHVRRLIDFARDWHADEPHEPVVVHCWAGISRSTAGAFIMACALRPHADEAMIAQTIRTRSASAMPNARLVALADSVLNRQGRMTAAIRAIGKAPMAAEGDPFHLDLAEHG